MVCITEAAIGIIKDIHSASIDWMAGGRIKFDADPESKSNTPRWLYRPSLRHKFRAISAVDVAADAYAFLRERWGEATTAEVRELVGIAKLNARNYDIEGIRSMMKATA